MQAQSQDGSYSWTPSGSIKMFYTRDERTGEWVVSLTELNPSGMPITYHSVSMADPDEAQMLHDEVGSLVNRMIAHVTGTPLPDLPLAFERRNRSPELSQAAANFVADFLSQSPNTERAPLKREGRD